MGVAEVIAGVLALAAAVLTYMKSRNNAGLKDALDANALLTEQNKALKGRNRVLTTTVQILRKKLNAKLTDGELIDIANNRL